MRRIFLYYCFLGGFFGSLSPKSESPIGSSGFGIRGSRLGLCSGYEPKPFGEEAGLRTSEKYEYESG